MSVVSKPALFVRVGVLIRRILLGHGSKPPDRLCDGAASSAKVLRIGLAYLLRHRWPLVRRRHRCLATVDASTESFAPSICPHQPELSILLSRLKSTRDLVRVQRRLNPASLEVKILLSLFLMPQLTRSLLEDLAPGGNHPRTDDVRQRLGKTPDRPVISCNLIRWVEINVAWINVGLICHDGIQRAAHTSKCEPSI